MPESTAVMPGIRRREGASGPDYLDGGGDAFGIPATLLRLELRIGAGLRRPALIGRLLFLDADFCGDLVPLRGNLIDDRLGILTGPQAADALPQRLLIVVGLQDREIQKAGLGCLMQRRQIVLRIWPARQIDRIGVVRDAEWIAKRIGKLYALGADVLAVQPLD